MSSKKVFDTAITRLLNIQHPILCGGMHYVTYAELAGAVSNAGGLGMVTALTQPSAEDLRQEIRKVKALTDKPFGVNLTLLPMLVPPDYEAYARVVVEERADNFCTVETAGHYKGLEPFVDLFKKNNFNVIHKCTQVRHAMTAEKMGVDAVSIDGVDCGGHPSEQVTSLWVLLERCKEKLNIPYVATGGCATGSQLAAAFALGASGMCMGTRFMAVKEAPVHANIQQSLVDCDENDTTLIMQTMKNTERVFKNKAVQEFKAIEAAHPGEFDKVKHLISGRIYKEVFQETGDVDSGVWSCGNSMGLIKNVPTTQELLDEIISEAKDTIENKLPYTMV